MECHASAPVHNLKDSGQWNSGVGKLLSDPQPRLEYDARIGKWIEKAQYPASWVLVSEVLSERFETVRVSLFDIAESVAVRYEDAGSISRSLQVHLEFRKEDGYLAAKRLDHAELVFLDPPYSPNAEKHWRKLILACRTLSRKCIPFVAWYPYYWPTKPQKLLECTGCGALEIKWSQCGDRPSQNLKGCGMLISPELSLYVCNMEESLKRLAIRLNAEFSILLPE